MIDLDIVERLRGKVRVPVNDGAGLLDGKDFFERSFPTSKAALEAADEIERLRAALTFIRDGYERVDVNHVDYRVGAYKAALDALAPAHSEYKEKTP
jgi:hypothetical protein